MVMHGVQSALKRGDEGWRRLWMESYFKGKAPTGESFPEHQTVLRLAPFEDGSAGK